MRAERAIVWLMAVWLAIVAAGCSARPDRVRIAAGTTGSGIHTLGKALAEVFNAKVSDVEASVVESTENRNSLDLVVRGEAELAVAFSDSEGDGEIRTLVPLYELYLYIIVWDHAGIADVPSLGGRKVGIGPRESGTDTVARHLFDHYEFEPGQVTLLNSGYRKITAAFLKQELDAMFILGSVESKAVSRVLHAPGTTLLSLDDPELVAPVMDGIRSRHPFVVSHIIPKHLFGTKPTKPTGVIGVNALLVAHADLPDETARQLTQAVFKHKVALGAKVRRLREIDERFDPAGLRFPLHPGAAQYYRRDEPPAIMQWADTISLFITILVLAWSGVLAIVARRRQKRKGLMDDFFRQFQKVAHCLDETTETDELQQAWQQLHDLRWRVFEALMDGKVEANASFIVFHDYLRSEVQEIERILRARKEPSASDTAPPSSAPDAQSPV